MRDCRLLIRLVLVAALCVLAGMTRPAAAAAQRPNVLFIYMDDHAYQTISALGSVVNTTPNIDRLAKQGAVFTNCVVTNSICGPCRAVVQTGKHSHLNGFYRNGLRFDGSQQTFPKLLQKAGYQTAIVGKWHLASVPQGYDYSEVLVGQGPYYNPPMLLNGNPKRVQHTGYTTEIITDLALKWLREKRDPGKPFVLMYQHKAPHRRWEPKKKYYDRFEGVVFPEPDTLFDDYSGRTSAARNQDMTIAKTMNRGDLKLTGPPRNLNEQQKTEWHAMFDQRVKDSQQNKREGKELVRWKYQRYMRDYLSCIAAVDDCVGKVLDYLDTSGLAKNTIVIYTSDQGFYMGEHGWFDKRFMYEQSFKTPFIIRWPGVIEPGTKNDTLISNLDFAETFLDLAGAPIPDDMQGLSLVPVLKGQTPDDWRKAVYYHYYEYPAVHSVKRHYGAYDGRYKLICFYKNRHQAKDEWELFDLEKDPKELQSVYGSSDYAQVQKRLAGQLQQLRKQYKVPEADPDLKKKR